MTADPKPRKRVRDPELLAEMARKPCQITGIGPLLGSVITMKVDSHHLCGRHDEPGNIFRILHVLHMEFTGGKRKKAVGALIRAYMTREQEDYIIREKGDAWLDATYPSGE